MVSLKEHLPAVTPRYTTKEAIGIESNPVSTRTFKDGGQWVGAGGTRVTQHARLVIPSASMAD